MAGSLETWTVLRQLVSTLTRLHVASPLPPRGGHNRGWYHAPVGPPDMSVLMTSWTHESGHRPRSRPLTRAEAKFAPSSCRPVRLRVLARRGLIRQVLWGPWKSSSGRFRPQGGEQPHVAKCYALRVTCTVSQALASYLCSKPESSREEGQGFPAAVSHGLTRRWPIPTNMLATRYPQTRLRFGSPAPTGRWSSGTLPRARRKKPVALAPKSTVWRCASDRRLCCPGLPAMLGAGALGT